MGDIFREVDEELKQERYEKLWRRYGKYAIGGAIMMVAAVAGWKFWETHQTSQRLAEGVKFAVATELLRDGKAREAAEIFGKLSEETASGYGTLSSFYEASIKAKTGNHIAAIKVYDEIAKNGSVSRSIRDLASILAGLQATHVPSIDGTIITKKIQPLSVAGRPYRHIALEILALTAERTGDLAEARANYRAIVDDPNAAAEIRTRAAQMLNILGKSN
ncbi:MAG: tetratricopeptide repeat protein [Pseudomonadota bacterium]|nr:tetratricopeptide repeat protein [Pseudomonadota bacterium]